MAAVFKVRARVRPLWRWYLGRLFARFGRLGLAIRLWAGCVSEIREPGRMVRRPYLTVAPIDPSDN